MVDYLFFGVFFWQRAPLSLETPGKDGRTLGQDIGRHKVVVVDTASVQLVTLTVVTTVLQAVMVGKLKLRVPSPVEAEHALVDLENSCFWIVGTAVGNKAFQFHLGPSNMPRLSASAYFAG